MKIDGYLITITLIKMEKLLLELKFGSKMQYPVQLCDKFIAILITI